MRATLSSRTIFTLLLSLALVATAWGADGDLDTTFDGDGIRTHDLSGNDDDGRDMVLDENGDILLVGTTDPGAGDDLLVAKFNPNGTRDFSFDTNGWTSLDPFGNNDDGLAIALQDDGQILVAGNTNDGTDEDFLLARYNPDGSLDTSFSTDGWRRYDFAGGDDFAYDLLVLESGVILVCGYATTGGGAAMPVVAAFTSTGALDTSFGDSGIFTHGMSGDGRLRAMLELPDNRIVLAGYWTGSSSTDAFLLIIDQDGNLDPSFGDNGQVTLEWGNDDQFNALLRQPDGKILAGGSLTSLDGTDMCMARYNLDGSLDTTYGNSGIACHVGGDTTDFIRSLALQDDRRVLACGSTFNGLDNDFSIARFNEDGSIDTTFGTDGATITDMGGNEGHYALILGNDTVLSTGISNDVLYLIRYETSIQSLADSDFDGVDDADDDYPDDSTRATVTTTTGTGKFTIDVSGVPGAILADVAVMADDDASLDQTGRPDGGSFTDGLVAFTVKGIPWGATIEVEVTCPTTPEGDTVPFKANSNGFADFSDNSVLTGNTYTLTLTDGGDGDGDNTVNGEIVDPFGPAWGASTGSNGGGGGGCALAPAFRGGGAFGWLLMLLGPALLVLRRRVKA